MVHFLEGGDPAPSGPRPPRPAACTGDQCGWCGCHQRRGMDGAQLAGRDAVFPGQKYEAFNEGQLGTIDWNMGHQKYGAFNKNMGHLTRIEMWIFMNICEQPWQIWQFYDQACFFFAREMACQWNKNWHSKQQQQVEMWKQLSNRLNMR